jgi:predicted dithiol-disulfide oxidoreductase (DUF899 family)
VPRDSSLFQRRPNGWGTRSLSSAGNTYNSDYFSETTDGHQQPMLNVFHRDGDAIRHFWGSELFYAPTDAGQDPRQTARSSRSGICSTSPQKDAAPTGTNNSTTPDCRVTTTRDRDRGALSTAYRCPVARFIAVRDCCRTAPSWLRALGVTDGVNDREPTRAIEAEEEPGAVAGPFSEPRCAMALCQE